jgi:hypothetical protein
MPWNDRQPRSDVAVDDMQVGAADPAGRDLYQKIRAGRAA